MYGIVKQYNITYKHGVKIVSVQFGIKQREIDAIIIYPYNITEGVFKKKKNITEGFLLRDSLNLSYTKLYNKLVE